MYEAMAAGDLAAASATLHPEVVLHVPGTHRLAGVHVGPSGVLDFIHRTRGLTEHGEDVDVLDVLVGRDHVGVYCTVRATRAGRAPLENTTVHLLRIQDGRVAEIWLHNFDDLSVNDFWS